ncbi:MAG: hypothetical protein ACD_40C00227G0001, partial [uncultured bacterium]
MFTGCKSGIINHFQVLINTLDPSSYALQNTHGCIMTPPITKCAKLRVFYHG